MSELTRTRDHMRAMAAAEHKPECPARNSGGGSWELDETQSFMHWVPSLAPPTCAGCVTSGERELWTTLADEIDVYLTGSSVDVDLFGHLSVVPDLPDEETTHE